MTKEQIEQNAKDYVNDKADKGNYDYAVGQYIFFGKSATEKAYVAGAESREPEIDYGKELIRDILISINGTYLPNISEDTKELLKEAAFYVGVKIEV